MMTVSKLFVRSGALCVVLAGVVFLAGCHSDSAQKYTFTDVPGYSPGTTSPGTASPTPPVAPSNAGVGAAATPVVSGSWSNAESDELLKAGDEIKITFSDLPDLKTPIEIKIPEDGAVTLLENQSFVAAGKPRGELEKEIHKRYVPDYYKKMTVTINRKEMSRFYSVGGFVKAPGRQVYVDKIRVVAAIQSCGDANDFGDLKRVTVIRADSHSMKVNCIKARTNPKLNIEILPGDTIYVPKRLPWSF